MSTAASMLLLLVGLPLFAACGVNVTKRVPPAGGVCPCDRCATVTQPTHGVTR